MSIIDLLHDVLKEKLPNILIDLLHDVLKEKLPNIHATRLQALMAAVQAGLKGASVSITQLGRSLSGPVYIRHKIKRMDRLAGNYSLTS